MKRRLLTIAVAVILVVAGWLVGRTTAQARVADFELSIEAPRGEMRLMCSRGCDWPSTGALGSISYQCDSEQCRWTINGRGPVTLGFPL